MKKFIFKCSNCHFKTQSFKEWFTNGQKCPKCGEIYSITLYKNHANYKKILSKKSIKNLWHYYDLLPLNNRKNITTLGEGILPISRLKRLEKVIKKEFNINCEINVLRNDLNPGTGTFKDLAGTMVASVLKENNIKNYVVASTGNVGASFARYLGMNNISLYAFIPKEASKLQEADIASNGGIVYRVNGDYHEAKMMAKAFAEKNNFLLAATGIDPTRIEAKKTMAYEIFRQLQKETSIYIQALSGGTGPIGLFKGNQELIEHNIIKKHPRLLLIQSNACAPMSTSYQKAKKNNFKGEWQKEYDILKNPDTKITTIATGNPTLYPYVSTLVNKTQGDILSVNENLTMEIHKLISILEGIKIGPAAAIAVLGLFKALKLNLIKDKESIVINIGEGISRSSDYLEQFYTGKIVSSSKLNDIPSLKNIRNDIIKNFNNNILSKI